MGIEERIFRKELGLNRSRFIRAGEREGDERTKINTAFLCYVDR